MPLIRVSLLIFHRVHFAIENVTNRIFLVAKREMSCKKADVKVALNECPNEEESSNIHAIKNLFH